VDLGDGMIRKLPFDNGSNPMEAAERFLAREGLGRGYSEEIAKFIRQNSLNYKTSENTRQGSGGVGQLSQKVAAMSTLIPWKQELYFDQINVDGPKKKIIEHNG